MFAVHALAKITNIYTHENYPYIYRYRCIYGNPLYSIVLTMWPKAQQYAKKDWPVQSLQEEQGHVTTSALFPTLDD